MKLKCRFIEAGEGGERELQPIIGHGETRLMIFP